MAKEDDSQAPPQRLKLARQVIRQTGWVRLAATTLFLVFAVFVCRYSWSIPLIKDAARAFYGMRMLVAAPAVGQDQRIVLVTYNDETLRNTGIRSPLDRAILARALRQLDAMGAKAVGIDVMIDQPRPEDPELIAALGAMRLPTYLAFATNEAAPRVIQLWQEEFVRNFKAQVRNPNVRFAHIIVDPDPEDGVMRSWPRPRPGLPPSFANALAGGVHPEMKDYTGSIAYRLPADPSVPVFSNLPIDLVADPETAPLVAPQIRGRIVLIGTDVLEIDRFDTPINLRPAPSATEDVPAGDEQPADLNERIPGVEIHATMLAQQLDGAVMRQVPDWALWLAAVLVVAAAIITSLADLRPWKLAIALIVQIVGFGLVPFWLQQWGVDTQFLPAFGWIVGWVIAFTAASSAARAVNSEQRRFAQSALGKYLPRDIANEIMRDPERLALHGEKRGIFVVFTDLEGFTKLSHAIEPEMVALLLNRYLDMLSAVVLRHGGTIDKFVGDAVVAFWGAPISRPDDGERAARAARAMYEAGEEFRRSVPPGLPPIGRTRVGLHYGEAIVGNFGGEGRIQYTALGDSMNTAARLESANKQLKTTVLASRDAVDRSGLDWWRPMGTVTLRGRATPIEVFEPVPDMAPEARQRMRMLFSLGSLSARELCALLAAEAPIEDEDPALQCLIERLNKTKEGSFVLD